jgi:hypothetical protein
VPRPTIVEIPLAEQARMRAELRRARYGYLLALHLLLLCAEVDTDGAQPRFESVTLPTVIAYRVRLGTRCRHLPQE